jgi:hypothetical protein
MPVKILISPTNHREPTQTSPSHDEWNYEKIPQISQPLAG